MKLAVDIGNSLVKIAVFNRDELIETKIIESFNQEVFLGLLAAFSGISSAIISDVRSSNLSFLEAFKQQIHLIKFDESTNLPIKNLYKTPATLGKDRLAGVIGAADMFSSGSILVIDAGTSITYDFINENREYLGGGISPGISMRFKALNTFTGKLPLVKPEWEKEISLIGESTETSILSGVQYAVLREVDGMINHYNQQFEKLNVVITGGDYKYFDKYLKNNIFAAPNLVLSGLKKILDFNEKD
jgi:type III pantothenate kinase